MESTYTRGAAAKRTGTRARKTESAKNYRHKGLTLGPRECKRLAQLGVCVALFLTVFLGRGIFPQRLQEVRGQLLTVLESDTDFRAAFSNLGASISSGEPVVETLGNLWGDVFGGGTVTSAYANPLEHAPVFDAELVFLASQPAAADILQHRTGISIPTADEIAAKAESVQPQEPPPEPVSQPEPASQPAYTGPALPDNATMDALSLGLNQTVSPVMAVVSSDYGWREHPIEGGMKFHSGVDLAAPYGDAIGAFADGVVDYIGESPAYGQYLQIKHAGGVTSFYAHCSKLLVKPGQQVVMGQEVAQVGDTGETTGAHLHMELRLNGVLLNPLYYIETE